MYGYIYKTTDKHTNKIYVGKKHSKVFKGIDYIGSGLMIKNIKNKCLRENIPIDTRFSVEMIDTAETLEELNEKEIYWIEKLGARNPSIGYNMRKGGDCGPGGPRYAGHKHSEETKRKMSESRKGCKNSNFGNHWHQSQELRELHSKLSSGKNNGMYGKHQSEESKRKSREKHLGRIFVSNVELDLVISIHPEELNDYLSNGWIKKNIHNHGSKVQRLSK